MVGDAAKVEGAGQCGWQCIVSGVDKGLHQTENALDYIGKYGIVVGSVTGAARLAIGALTALVSLVAFGILAILDMCGVDMVDAGVQALNTFTWGWKHVAIGATEIPPGLKWFLLDVIGYDLTSHPSGPYRTELSEIAQRVRNHGS